MSHEYYYLGDELFRQIFFVVDRPEIGAAAMANLIESELWPVFSQLTSAQVEKALENMQSAVDEPHASMPHVGKRPLRAKDLGIDGSAWQEVLSFFHSDTTQPKSWLEPADSLRVVVQKTESGQPGFFLHAGDSAKLIDVFNLTRNLEKASSKDELIEKWNDIIASAAAVYCLQKVDEFADQSRELEKASSLQLNYVIISDHKLLEIIRSIMPDQETQEARFVIIDRASTGEMQHASIIRFSVQVAGQNLLIGLNGTDDISLDDIAHSLQNKSGSTLLLRSVAGQSPVLIDYSGQN